MGRPKNPLRIYLDDARSKTEGSVKKHPCNYCGIYVSSTSREITTHFEKACKRIPADKKIIISKTIDDLKTPSKNKNINKNVSRAALGAISSSTSIDTNSSSTVSSSISHSNSGSVLLQSPPHQKRKVKVESNLFLHFQRSMNPRNYASALTFFFKWYLSTQRLEFSSINEDFNDFCAFLCPSFAAKFKAEDLMKAGQVFKNGIERIISKELNGDCGFIGCYYHSGDEAISLWVVTESSVYFMEESLYLDEDEVDEQVEKLINKLNLKKFTIFGMKLNCALLDNEELYSKVKHVASENNIAIIANLKHKLEEAMEYIVRLDGVDETIDKLEIVVACIKTTRQIRKELKKLKCIDIPDNVINQISYLNTIKPHLQSICNLDVDIRVARDIRTIIFMDESFWQNIALFSHLFEHLIDVFNRLTCSNDMKLSEACEQVKEMVLYYETTDFPAIYNQLNCARLKRCLKKKINLFDPQQNIFDGQSFALFYLSYFMDPAFEVSAHVHQIKESRLILKSLCTIELDETYQNWYRDLRVGRGVFEDLNGIWDDLVGTEYGTFAALCKNICAMKSAPLETVLPFCSDILPDVVDAAVYFNLMNKDIVSKNMKMLSGYMNSNMN